MLAIFYCNLFLLLHTFQGNWTPQQIFYVVSKCILINKKLKIKEDLPTKRIEGNIESTGIAQEELVFFDTTDQQETTEKET